MTTTGGTTATTVAEAIGVAIRLRRVTVGQAIKAARMSSSKWYRCMADGAWTVTQLERLGLFLGVSISDLLGGAEMVAHRIKGGGLLPHLDSNQEPSDFESVAA